VPDWARTIARHWLYETADAIRIADLKASDDPSVAGLAEKIDREETYHRMHADMWAERLRDEPRFLAAVDDLWPYSLGILADSQREALCERVGREPVDPIERGEHTDELAPLWEEMTMVRRSVAGATW
jgi:1,2-phenylacetyl-CoA epoxidase catalytic subunit